MRMWGVNPKFLCRKHLLGEHLELHMFLGTIKKGVSIKGFVKNGLIDTSKLEQRHNELVEEMANRGYKHKTPLSYKDNLHIGKIDTNNSINELNKRCKDCRERINKFKED